MKRIAIPILILTLVAMTAFAAPRPGGGPPGPPPQQQQGPGAGGDILPPQLLAEFLGLTEAQTAAMATLRESMRATVEPLHEQQRANADAIRDAVEAGNAATAGSLLVANHAIGQQIKAAHDSFKTASDALLTAEQKAKLAVYQEIVELRRGARD